MKDAYTPIDFTETNQQAIKFAQNIQNSLDSLTELLLEYETFEVAVDEIARTLDLLTSLRENEEYFKLRIGEITTFLPRNQPLYALTCFVLVPSLMSSQVHFRIPQSLTSLLPKIIMLLKVHSFFPNLNVSNKERMEFLKERSALLINPKTKQTRPVTDAVIFTGNPKHAEQLRLVFDRRVLFITNGAGHNPVVVGERADIKAAVKATLTLSLYNQGQDCAAPNSILVHEAVYIELLNELRKSLQSIKTGPYQDRECLVGPISDPNDLPYIQSVIVSNREWLDDQTPGVIHTASAIVEPTLICKPLSEGGNYEESFSPIIFIQKYQTDLKLADYFETEEYKKHMMYVTLYGESQYVRDLMVREIDGIIMHPTETFLHNTHLHAPEVERGTKPYGGYGRAASNISLGGNITNKPTLPQRDIFEQLVLPVLKKADNVNSFIESQTTFTEFEERKVEKILKLHNGNNKGLNGVVKKKAGLMFCDSENIDTSHRFVKITQDTVYYLNVQPNVSYIATLNPHDVAILNELKKMLRNKLSLTFEEFKIKLYDIPKVASADKQGNSERQLAFFKNIYWLLFNQDNGPRLINFLWEVDFDDVDKLIDL